MKRVLIAIAAVAATGIAVGAVHAQNQGEEQHAAEHKHGKHAERHQRMAERHQHMAERHARHGEHRQGGSEKPAAQPKAEEHKH